MHLRITSILPLTFFNAIHSFLLQGHPSCRYPGCPPSLAYLYNTSIRREPSRLQLPLSIYRSIIIILFSPIYPHREVFLRHTYLRKINFSSVPYTHLTEPLSSLYLLIPPRPHFRNPFPTNQPTNKIYIPPNPPGTSSPTHHHSKRSLYTSHPPS